ncbi:MAG: acyl carrier protein [Desulfocapsa sp.]|nr:acyl carrier protein [Desulfocapsa sp.]
MSVEEKVMRIMKEQACLPRYDEEKMTMASNLTDDLHMDSLDVIEAAMALEDAFDVEIDDETLVELDTIQDYVDTIGALVEKN